MTAKSSCSVLDNDRKTRDFVSAFLTYRGYETMPLDGDDSFFDTPAENIQRILIAEQASLATKSADMLPMALAADPRLVVILYGTEDNARPLPHDERLIFLAKPLNLDELESVVMRALEFQALQVRTPEQPVDEISSFSLFNHYRQKPADA